MGVCGGSTSSGHTASCLEFNSQTKTWEKHGNMRNKYRSFATSIALKRGVYILGGSFDRTQARVYSETSGLWTQWPGLTEGVWAHSCVLLGDKIVMAGGWESSGRFTGRTVIIDTKTGS